MRFAVIGSAHGHIYQFIEDMNDLGAEFVGIYDDNSNLVNDIKEKYEVPVYQDLDNLFAEDLDIVATSAINNQKMGFISECSKHGVHVIADKPIVVNYEQYNKLEKIIEEGNIEIGLMLTVRFMPQVYKVKQLIDNGIIGDLINVEIFSPHKLRANERPAWHFDKEQNGGIIVDLMPHSVDLYNWLTEDKIKGYNGVVQKTILPEYQDFYDSSQFFITGEKGSSGYLRVDWHMANTHWSWGDIRIFCSGTKGEIESRVTGDPLTKDPKVILFEEGKETREIEVDEINLSVTKDFVKRIKGQEYIIGHQDILKASKISLDFSKKAEKINKFENQGR